MIPRNSAAVWVTALLYPACERAASCIAAASTPSLQQRLGLRFLFIIARVMFRMILDTPRVFSLRTAACVRLRPRPSTHSSQWNQRRDEKHLCVWGAVLDLSLISKSSLVSSATHTLIVEDFSIESFLNQNQIITNSYLIRVTLSLATQSDIP